MKLDSHDPNDTVRQPSFLGLPVCPHCGKRLNPLVAWLYKTHGEYQCPNCAEISLVTANPKTLPFGLAAVFLGCVILAIFMTVEGRMPFWGVALLVIPFVVFTAVAPFLVRLQKIEKKPANIKEPERVHSQKNRGQRSLPKVGQQNAGQKNPAPRPANAASVNPNSPYSHHASRPPQYRNPQPPKNYNSAQRTAQPNRPVQTNRPSYPNHPGQQNQNHPQKNHSGKQGYQGKPNYAGQQNYSGKPNYAGQKNHAGQQNRTQQNRPGQGARPQQKNHAQQQNNRPVQTNRPPSAKPNLYPSMPPKQQRPVQTNRPPQPGRPNQQHGKRPNNAPAARPNLFDTAEFGKRAPKDFSGYQDK